MGDGKSVAILVSPEPVVLVHLRGASIVRRNWNPLWMNRSWEKQALSARGFKRVGRRSEYAIYTGWRCVRRGPGGSRKRPRGFK